MERNIVMPLIGAGNAVASNLVRVCVCMAFVLYLMLLFGTAAAYAEDNPPDPGVDVTKKLTLDDCIRAALISSPYMKVESLSIDMKRIDAENEWFHMFPKVNLGLSSNVPVGGDNDKEASYSITLTSGTYDPITAYFQYDVKEEMVNLAKLEKLKKASELIESIAMVFIFKHSLDSILESYSRLEAIAEENLSYATKSFTNAPTVPLEVRLAEHKIKRIAVGKKKITRAFINHLTRLKRLLGLPAEMKIDLDISGFNQGFFEGFDPGGMSYEFVRANSIYEQMNRSRAKLAGYGVYAAWAEYVPKFNFSVRTPDPVNTGSSSDDNYYMTFSATVPLFHWGELGRNVDRAKIQEKWARQSGMAEDLKHEDEWYVVRSKVEELKGDVEIAEAECNMNGMSVRRAEILFNAGSLPYQKLLDAKMVRANADIQLAVANQLYMAERLHAFSTSGALLRRFIKVEDSNESAK